MKTHKMLYLPAALLCCAMMAPFAQASSTFLTAVGATTGGGAISAEAIFTLGNNDIQITLYNLGVDPIAVSQLISGLQFNVTGSSASGALATTNKGMISTISGGGAYTAGISDPLTRWTASESGAVIGLTMFGGGTPDRLIIGAPNTVTNLFTSANPSITGTHNPSVLSTATFDLAVAGVTAQSVLSNVLFKFGTQQDWTTDISRGILTPPTSGGAGVVPEPSMISLLGLGLLALRTFRNKLI